MMVSSVSKGRMKNKRDIWAEWDSSIPSTNTHPFTRKIFPPATFNYCVWSLLASQPSSWYPKCRMHQLPTFLSFLSPLHQSDCCLVGTTCFSDWDVPIITTGCLRWMIYHSLFLLVVPVLLLVIPNFLIHAHTIASCPVKWLSLVLSPFHSGCINRFW